MIKTFTLALFVVLISNIFAQDTAKLSREQFIHSQTIKSDSLNQKALQLAVPGASAKDLNQAINYIMQGLHAYAKFGDSVGLRETFDHLALTYHLQKKYVQAKWFYIQSNSISRDKRDTLNIIHSLMNLASVKTDIKDYSMAYRDLKEAMQLSRLTPKANIQIETLNGLANFYTKKGDAQKAALALNRIAFIKDSVQKQDKARLAAAMQQKTAHKQAILKKETPASNHCMLVILLIIFILAISFLIIYPRKPNKKTT